MTGALQYGTPDVDAAHWDLETTVAIIGSGFAGLGMAIKLRRRGRDDFLIVEKAYDVGGTWRENTYPGCGCDVPTVLYSYSFEQNPYWSKLWAPQPEIQAYLRRMADKYDLRRRTLFGTEIVSTVWNEATSRWCLRSADGRTITAQFVVIGVGPLHRPNIPALDGIKSFTGPTFHSAQWDHGVDLKGKKVAVIGTGASAIQFVPIIAEHVEHLQLYQRTPPWVLGRPDPTIPASLRRLFAQVPITLASFRAAIYWFAESMGTMLYGRGGLHRLLEWVGKANLRKSIKDPALVDKLTPDYQIGCNRLLVSSTYYPALARPNVEVITDGIEQVGPGSVRTVDGCERAVDVIIYATGFRVSDLYYGLDIHGVAGESMVQRWNTDGIRSHLGVTIAGLPNLFFLLGANSGVAYTSVVFMIEQQIRYVLRAMDSAQQRAAASIRVRRDVQDTFHGEIQRRSARKAWTNGTCTNWFVDSRGVNIALWPGLSWQYWRASRRFDDTDFEFAAQQHIPDGARVPS